MMALRNFPAIDQLPRCFGSDRCLVAAKQIEGGERPSCSVPVPNGQQSGRLTGAEGYLKGIEWATEPFALRFDERFLSRPAVVEAFGALLGSSFLHWLQEEQTARHQNSEAEEAWAPPAHQEAWAAPGE